jgi:hypothetical protein
VAVSEDDIWTPPRLDVDGDASTTSTTGTPSPPLVLTMLNAAGSGGVVVKLMERRVSGSISVSGLR